MLAAARQSRELCAAGRRRRGEITLKPDDFLAFLAALDAPAAPNAALERAFERHAQSVRW
ncbi:MAG: DUF1778 domain-containing protein [Betaproteobacteria bacterium]|nr:DUF1778 domain-containing protein [Betaproteobacteria bacterium]